MLNSSMVMTDLYPVVIRQSRYGGVYEGGEWVAFADYDDIDREVLDDYFFGDDDGAIELFTEQSQIIYGVGKTPDEALASLLGKYRSSTTVGEL